MSVFTEIKSFLSIPCLRGRPPIKIMTSASLKPYWAEVVGVIDWRRGKAQSRTYIATP